jgi:hypothetical protein
MLSPAFTGYDPKRMLGTQEKDHLDVISISNKFPWGQRDLQG